MVRLPHIQFRLQFLCLLFVLINGVCVAAPIFHLASQIDDTISARNGQFPKAIEAEEENHAASPTFLNQPVNLAITKQGYRVNKKSFTRMQLMVYKAFTGSQKKYLTVSEFLPPPGYYTALFQYHLF